MSSLLKLIVLLVLTSPAVSFAVEEGADEQLIVDCRAEGEAMGFSGEDLEDYAVECVEEFHEAEMGNNVKLN